MRIGLKKRRENLHFGSENLEKNENWGNGLTELRKWKFRDKENSQKKSLKT